MSATYPRNNRSQCNGNASVKSQVDSGAFEYITQNMFELMRWPVEQIESKHHNPFPSASVSFVVNGDDSSIPEGKRLEARNSFALSRRRMGNSLKRLYSALEEEGMKFKWKNVTISGDKESLVFGFLTQRCPNGTRRHENGFLCDTCIE
ncbi:hypothetical protein OS493_036233 [Desmophyllum pertusum]|uniref:Uncharacterized protein n=1 Tax=Desmophyllum pertusum TaxID=174260 RepID=A0A9W9ZWZ0_9CNID|nr:hypothetical protein OS493_036233 [Desmophyllum pertusum]